MPRRWNTEEASILMTVKRENTHYLSNCSPIRAEREKNILQEGNVKSSFIRGALQFIRVPAYWGPDFWLVQVDLSVCEGFVQEIYRSQVETGD